MTSGSVPQDIGEQELVAVPVDIEGLVEGYFCPEFVAAAQIHENFILDTLGRVSGQLNFFPGSKVLTALIRPMVPIEARSSKPIPVFFKFPGNINHQPQIAFDENSFDGVTLGPAFLSNRLLLPPKGAEAVPRGCPQTKSPGAGPTDPTTCKNNVQDQRSLTANSSSSLTFLPIIHGKSQCLMGQRALVFWPHRGIDLS